MQEKKGLLNIVPLMLIGLAGFLIFAGFLISEQILNAFADTEKVLTNKAQTVASRLEDTFKQTRERVEIIALNPVIQKDPQTVMEYLTMLMRISPSYEALFVIETDGSLVAGIPMSYDFNSLIENNDLNNLLDECEILCLVSERKNKSYVFASAALSKSTPGVKDRIIIALINLNRITEAALLENTEYKVSLSTVNNSEIILSSPDIDTHPDSVPIMITILNRIAVGQPPAYLEGTASVPKPKWTVSVSTPYDIFLVTGAQKRFSNYRFYVLLFLPVFLIFTVIMLVINESRRFFKDLSSKDSLTGLYNHRSFQTALRNEIDKQDYRNISLLMIDVDDFKQFNDTYGHQAGDQILKGIANILLSNIRSTDIAARYGGEEFIVVLPGIRADDALLVAERIRQAVKRKGKTTISIGVSSFPEYAETAQQLIQGADKAMYAAKNHSKDCVEGVWNLN